MQDVTATRIRAAVELAAEALVRVQRLDDPTLWTGPAASRFRAELDERRRFVRAALGEARSAADALDAAASAADPADG